MSAFSDAPVRKLIEEKGIHTVIETLGALISDRRKKRIDEVLFNRIDSIQVALESPSDVHNALAVLRSSEALGVSHAHLIDAEVKKKTGQGTTKGSLHWAHLYSYPTAADFLTKKKKDFLLVGAHLQGSIPLDEVPIDKSMIVVFGNEHRGLSSEMVAACDLLFRIPMYGMVESFNLSVSAAITLYELTKKKRKVLPFSNTGDVSALEFERSFYYIRSLGLQRAKKILDNQRV